MTKLNFKIRPAKDILFDQVTTQVTPIQERQSSPAHPRRNRTLSGASSSLASSSGESAGGPLCSEIEMHSHNGNYWSKPKRGRQPRGERTTTTRDETYFTNGKDDDLFLEESSSSSTSEEEEEREYSNNERLLLVAFVSFMSFSLTQLYFAFRAESEAMKGDSAAMIVDSLTYLFNWIAERQKHTFDRNYQHPPNTILTPERARQLRERTKRKVTLQWEIIPPLVSVSTLLVVTGVVLRQALRVIWLDLHRNPNEQSDPNIDLMMVFALVNLGLDGVNFCCFAQASHLFGYDTMEDGPGQNSASSSIPTPHPNGSGHVALDFSESEEYDDDEDFMREHQRHSRHHTNLNMCSAYTHVFADTLRSLAVILASALAEIFDEVTAEEADAAAALVVSLLILLSLVPLFQGLQQSVWELWGIRAEERSEIMMNEIKQEERKRRDNFWNGGRAGAEEWTG